LGIDKAAKDLDLKGQIIAAIECLEHFGQTVFKAIYAEDSCFAHAMYIWDVCRFLFIGTYFVSIEFRNIRPSDIP
jgi:hypothetical protein